MSPGPVLAGDPIRLAALDAYAILDTPPETDFDNLVLLARMLCAAPMALVSFVADDRQWFKARSGFDLCQTDLNASVCVHALGRTELLVFPDLTQDPRTRDNPLVTGEPHIRFYAGAPLHTPEGATLGSLCVIDTVPRPEGLSPAQADGLRALAAQVMAQMGLRRAVAERDEAIRRVRESETTYRTVFENIDAGFCICEVKFDADGRAIDHRVLDANAAFERYTGIANAVGRYATEVAPGIEQHWHDAYGSVLKTGQPVRFEAEAAPLGRWYDAHLFPAGGERVAMLITDVTARRHAQSALKSLNETLEGRVAEQIHERTMLWNSSPDLMLVIDFKGVFREVNPAWTTLLGYPAEELVGHHVTEFVLPDDDDATREAYELAAAGGSPRLVNRYRHKDGSIRWISWVAAPSGRMTYATGRDVTSERQQAQVLAERTQELHVANARQRAMYDATRQLIGVLDLDGTLRDANRASLDAIGATRRDVVDKPFAEAPWFAGTPGMPDVVRGGIAAAGAGQSIRTEMALNLPDGSTRIYDFGMSPVRDPAGHVVEVVPEATDITELCQTEDALRQSQKMEAVGQLTGGLAHDFNNLLAGISGSLELMQTRMGQGRLGDLDRYMTVAQGATKRAAALTHRLLAFSRRQTLDPKPTNVNRLVADMEELIRRTIGPEIALEVVGTASLWPTRIDPGQLENALLNLCINARDVMPEGGRIVIETANKWLDRPAAVKHEIPEGQYLSLCVTDTGTGMPPEVIARVFEPFFTTKPLGQGTGLGLSMVYGFARQSGGQVRIYSEVGQGTTVCLYLPRHYGETEEEDVVARFTEAARAEQGETVLIVDDEPSVRMLVTEVLEDLGYTAIEANDSVAGLKVLQSDVRIDLLVTDVGLPGGLNGRQMADAGRERRPDLRVLFITGYAENAAVGNGHLAPGMQLLTKPFTLEALASRIKELIAAR